MHLQIPLDIPDVKIEKVDTSTTKGFVLTVSSTLKGTTCQQCGKMIDNYMVSAKRLHCVICRYLKALFGLK